MEPSLVTIETFESFSEAATAKVLLEMRGIDATLADVEMGHIWTSSVATIKLQVPASQEEVARLLVVKLKHTRLERESAGTGDNEKCLVCGAELSAGQRTCTACGWSFAGEDSTDYENAPVPDSLLPLVRSPLDTRKFALPADAIARYVEWCNREGLQIHGWEVWFPGIARHMVVDTNETGGGPQLVAAVPAAVARHGPEVLFCVNVEKSGARAKESEA